MVSWSVRLQSFSSACVCVCVSVCDYVWAQVHKMYVGMHMW